MACSWAFYPVKQHIPVRVGFLMTIFVKCLQNQTMISKELFKILSFYNIQVNIK